MIRDVTRDEAELMLKVVQGYVNTHPVHIEIELMQDGSQRFEIRDDESPFCSAYGVSKELEKKLKEKLNE